jgi:hypothetical protein
MALKSAVCLSQSTARDKSYHTAFHTTQQKTHRSAHLRAAVASKQSSLGHAQYATLKSAVQSAERKTCLRAFVTTVEQSDQPAFDAAHYSANGTPE